MLICYDFDEDDTLTAIRERGTAGVHVELVRNSGRGPHQAVISGFKSSKAPYILAFPADDDYNAHRLDSMLEKAKQGCDVVCASRFMPGGSMVGCPLLKSVLVRSASFTLRHLARLPTHDATNGMCLFSRRLLNTIRIESEFGFTYTIELLVKAHRLGLTIGEVPVEWHERSRGASRFRLPPAPSFF